ncbi:MAG: hypothetical protein Q8M76_03035 [Spirochaetaceae bacterium]|nr:hypothetical protein [Spirochaetaceae bacterium]
MIIKPRNASGAAPSAALASILIVILSACAGSPTVVGDRFVELGPVPSGAGILYVYGASIAPNGAEIALFKDADIESVILNGRTVNAALYRLPSTSHLREGEYKAYLLPRGTHRFIAFCCDAESSGAEGNLAFGSSEFEIAVEGGEVAYLALSVADGTGEGGAALRVDARILTEPVAKAAVADCFSEGDPVIDLRGD